MLNYKLIITMYDNYNYPMGADTPSAPWNEVSVPEETFTVWTSQTISKEVDVTTNDYIPIVDACEDGVYTENDTSETDWKYAYNSEHYTPLELINLFKERLEEEFKTTDESDKKKYYRLKKLIAECSGWTNDYIEFERQ